MAATVTYTGLGRTSSIATLSAISVTIGGNGASYATASGGLPFDLAALLKAAGITNDLDVYPTDVIGFVPLNTSTNGFLPMGLTLGTPTWQTQQPFGTQTSPAVPALASVQAPQELATYPCTIRLYSTGSADHGALHEVADGANSDSFTGLLLLNRNGNNV